MILLVVQESLELSFTTKDIFELLSLHSRIFNALLYLKTQSWI
jgi:hypothetical protein